MVEAPAFQTRSSPRTPHEQPQAAHVNAFLFVRRLWLVSPPQHHNLLQWRHFMTNLHVSLDRVEQNQRIQRHGQRFVSSVDLLLGRPSHQRQSPTSRSLAVDTEALSRFGRLMYFLTLRHLVKRAECETVLQCTQA